MTMSEGSSIPVRCLLLGASNVTLGFPLIAQALVRSLPPGSEVFAAHGHGRSYLRWSSVFHRGLPGIVQSGLWSELATRPPAQRTFALITDIGNDLIYGEPLAELTDAVAWCLEQFRGLNAEVVFVRPPVERLLRLSPRTYHVFKRAFFPGPVRPWAEMKELALRLDDELCLLSQESSVRVVTPPSSWYGTDPIHIRRVQRPAAWRQILGQWSWERTIEVGAVSPARACRWWTLKPAERRVFGSHQVRNQPVTSSAQGVSFWLY